MTVQRCTHWMVRESEPIPSQYNGEKAYSGGPCGNPLPCFDHSTGVAEEAQPAQRETLPTSDEIVAIYSGKIAPLARDEKCNHEPQLAELQSRLTAAEERERKLVEALTVYGEHNDWCLWLVGTNPCTCGLAALLAGSKG